ncbi:hypothetical protein THRCLA_02450 [Thraustotheca clavata]|uniref:Phosphoglycerate mutase n=1 Tax=Thraustotheca clavata TaxID=74557 RepID=A0A1W0A5E4_9STRA|nr:hypothetical protein THRCLA_02450 [Thraustotheca clavata]
MMSLNMIEAMSPLPADCTRLYLCRHGETNYNVEVRFQGSGINSELNARGQAQAKALGLAFKDVKLQGVYCSKLLRARVTAQAIQCHYPMLYLQEIDGIQEMHFGQHEGIKLDELQKEFHSVIDRWDEGEYDVAWPGGESASQLERRGTEALIKLCLTHAEGDRIAVVCHSRFNRIILASLIHHELRAMADIVQNNTCINVLDFNRTTRTFQAVTINNTDHWKWIV